MKQRSVRQETCSYKVGTLPLYAYGKKDAAALAIDVTFAEEQDEEVQEEVVDEYDSDSSEDETIEELMQEPHEETTNDHVSHTLLEQFDHPEILDFLRKNTRSGRQIKINYKFLQL